MKLFRFFIRWYRYRRLLHWAMLSPEQKRVLLSLRRVK